MPWCFKVCWLKLEKDRCKTQRGELPASHFAKFTKTVFSLDLGRGQWAATWTTLSPGTPAHPRPQRCRNDHLQPQRPGLGVGIAGTAGLLRKRNPSQVGEGAVAMATTKPWPNPRAVASFQKNKMKLKRVSLSRPRQLSTKAQCLCRAPSLNRWTSEARRSMRSPAQGWSILSSPAVPRPGLSTALPGGCQGKHSTPLRAAHIPAPGLPQQRPPSRLLTMLAFTLPFSPHFPHPLCGALEPRVTPSAAPPAAQRLHFSTEKC